MKVLDKSWHVQCVKCSECQCPLSEKCFSRESKLYCRSDFFRYQPAVQRQPFSAILISKDIDRCIIFNLNLVLLAKHVISFFLNDSITSVFFLFNADNMARSVPAAAVVCVPKTLCAEPSTRSITCSASAATCVSDSSLRASSCIWSRYA